MNTFNINIYTPKVQFPINQINIENKNSNIYNINGKEKDAINDTRISENINNEKPLNQDFIEDIKDICILMNNSDENSNILFTYKMLKENKENKNTNASDNFNSIIKLLSQKKLKKSKKMKNQN